MDKKRFVHFKRRAFADIFLAILVSLMIGVIHEYYILGISLIVVFKTRLISCFTRSIYGVYRDFTAYKITKKRRINKAFEYFIVNTFCSVTYNGILYAIILWVSGANQDQITKAVINIITFSILTGAIYGLFLDFFRRFFDITLPKKLKKFNLVN